MSESNFYNQRMAELASKFNLTSLVLEDAPRHTQIQRNAQDYINLKSRERAIEEQTYLKTRTVAYGSAKPVRLWLEISR